MKDVLTQFSPWLNSVDGRAALQRRAALAEAVLTEPGTATLYQLGWELALLALAEAHGLASQTAAWRSARGIFFTARDQSADINGGLMAANFDPPWRADLCTADIGAALALALSFSPTLRAGEAEWAALIREKCLAPIVADWLDDRTRIHSLDSMGHNWWAVIVSGAGIMAELLGDETLAASIAEKLPQWFKYPGNEWWRKLPNFGANGDYLEGCAYAEYGLGAQIIFSRVRPAFRWIPDGLDLAQARGLSDWLQRWLCKTPDGWSIQRCGDVNMTHGYHLQAAVWHSLGAAIGDQNLLALAHQVKPEPENLFDFLCWEPAPALADADVSLPSGLRVFPVSGMAFDRGERTALTVRAGEHQNHNHHDAGSFVFQQDGVTWLDDSGSCVYSRPDYLDYFVTPLAHNVTFVPALRPPHRRAFTECLPASARFLSAANNDWLTTLCADTGILSGGALARSHRWFLRLGDDAVLVWDDLAAYTPQVFHSLLHTYCELSGLATAAPVLEQDGRRLALHFFADANTEFSHAVIDKGGQPPHTIIEMADCRSRARETRTGHWRRH